MAEKTSNKERDEKEIIPVILAGLDYGNSDDFEHSIEEMKSLIEACDMKAILTVTQRLAHPDPGSYLGTGKAREISELAENHGAQYIIFEDNLSPAQLKNLQNIMNVDVWDRTTLILEIFSRRAKTIEARLQVESAYLKYMLPRLTGMWQHLGRQGGGGGSGAASNRGIGETQIELDRRQIKKRITELDRELQKIGKTRTTQKAGRKKSNIPLVSLVGYTNAGKSTIMNSMLAQDGRDEEKKVFEENMLFATLDTSIRHIEMDNNKDFLLSDTVGFIENLPHELIKAFGSTLEEAKGADLILIVLDASDPYHRMHKKVTEDTLRNLDAANIPRIYVMNKADLIDDRSYELPHILDDTIWISAKSGVGIPELKNLITEKIYDGNKLLEFLIPYSKGDMNDLLHRKAGIVEEEYKENGVRIVADVSKELQGILKEFVIEKED